MGLVYTITAVSCITGTRINQLEIAIDPLHNRSEIV